MPTLKLEIRGLQPSDEERVEALLKAQTGVYGAVADHDEACVEVDFEDDEESIEHLVGVLREAGFEARLAG